MLTYTYISKGKFGLVEKPKPTIRHERGTTVTVVLLYDKEQTLHYVSMIDKDTGAILIYFELKDKEDKRLGISQGIKFVPQGVKDGQKGTGQERTSAVEIS